MIGHRWAVQRVDFALQSVTNVCNTGSWGLRSRSALGSKVVTGDSTRMLRACPVATTRSRPPCLGAHLDSPRITIASIYRVLNARDSRPRPANTRHRIAGSGSDVSFPVSGARFSSPASAKFSVRPTPSGTRSRNLSERIVWVSFATNNIGLGAGVL